MSSACSITHTEQSDRYAIRNNDTGNTTDYQVGETLVAEAAAASNLCPQEMNIVRKA